MPYCETRRNSSCIAAIIVLHLLLAVTIWLDVFLIRQIAVFVYLTFVPGFVIFKVLKLENTSSIDKFLFSVGLSISFLMFVGISIDVVSSLIGFERPLSPLPLAIIIFSSTLLLSLAGYKEFLSEKLSSAKSGFLNSETLKKSAFLFLPLLLGVTAGLWGNVLLASAMIVAIAIFYVLSTFFPRIVPPKLYPLLIFALSLALVYQVLLNSNYIVGYDAQREFFVFRLTSINERWTLLQPGYVSPSTLNYNTMLSITVLPTIYASLMNTGGETVFKTLYPLIFSLIPVILFRIYRSQIGKSASLLSVLFFMSGSISFYGFEALSLNRQTMATLFLTLSILVLLNKTISTGKRRLLLLVFAASIAVSHYAMAFLYIAFIIIVFAISKIKHDPDNVLDTKTTLLLAIPLAWYAYFSTPITTILNELSKISENLLVDITDPAARIGWISGEHPAYGSATYYVGTVNWAFFAIAHFFTAIGILAILFKPAKAGLNIKYRVLAILNAIILFLCLAVPNIALLNFTRSYSIALLFLAPCFFLGCSTLVTSLSKALRKLAGKGFSSHEHRIIATLLCTVLVGYFLSQSGFINMMAGATPLSYSLDLDRVKNTTDPKTALYYYSVYIPEQDVYSALWLSRFGNTAIYPMYAYEGANPHQAASISNPVHLVVPDPFGTPTWFDAEQFSIYAVTGPDRGFGNAEAGYLEGVSPVGWVNAMRFEANETGSVSEIRMYCKTSNEKGIVQAMIYADVASFPSTLLVASSQVTVGTTYSWISFPLSINVVAGTYYWLAWFGDSLTYTKCSEEPGAPNSHQAATHPVYLEIPDPFGTPTRFDDYQISIYAVANGRKAFGNNEVGSLYSSSQVRQINAIRFQANETEVISEIRMYCRTNYETGTVRVSVYAESEGEPTTLLTTSPEVIVNRTYSWKSFPINLNATAGTDYWLAWLGSTTIYTKHEVDKYGLIHTDHISKTRALTSYGLFSNSQIHWRFLSNRTRLEKHDFIYLNLLNTKYGTLVGRGEIDYELSNLSDITPLLERCNLLYSNGNSEIYQAVR